jgi:soluble lytic murein transglycosylase
MNALASNPSAAPPLLISTMSQWSDISTFASILDRISSNLARQRQWDDILEIFLRLETMGPSAPLAQYAWIAGRALEEGYIGTNRQTGMEFERNAESFFRIAYETESASFYYRAMAASKLGLNVTLESEDSGTRRTAQQRAAGDEAEFLLGFFEYGAASFFLPYLRVFEEELSFPELRRVAEAFASAGQWQESLRLVARYIRREDYTFNIQDLFLSHPRPYLELIENYSREMEIGPEIFYGLVRTESHFMSAIASHAGAVGLAQLMPATAMDMAARIARRGGPDYRGPDGIDLRDPEINVHLGSFYLRLLMDSFENPMLALLAYNGGQGRVRRWLTADRQLGALPLDLFLETIEFHETREYGRRVLSAAAVYGYLYYGMSMEEAAASIFQ